MYAVANSYVSGGHRKKAEIASLTAAKRCTPAAAANHSGREPGGACSSWCSSAPSLSPHRSAASTRQRARRIAMTRRLAATTLPSATAVATASTLSRHLPTTRSSSTSPCAHSQP